MLITHNVRDFKAWHATFERQGRAHGGIIGLPQIRPFVRLELRAAMMLEWVGTQPYRSRLFVWGQLQRLLEQGFRLSGHTEEMVQAALGRD